MLPRSGRGTTFPASLRRAVRAARDDRPVSGIAESGGVDVIRFGRGLRALRRRRGWRQVDLARAGGVSQSLIARVERGGADRLTIRSLDRIANALGARVVVRLDFNGEALDRLLDADHAGIVERVIVALRAAGWTCATEVSFAIDGERGSVDVLARHPPSGIVLVIEVKSVIPDVQGTLMTLDRKARLGTRIARGIGWTPSAVGRVLVVADDRTARRRVAEHAATFAAHLPDRTLAVRRALGAPDPTRPLRGLWFLSGSTQATARHRVARPNRRRQA
jgi:transcriptional regulator with XRE-family HTH domain